MNPICYLTGDLFNFGCKQSLHDTKIDRMISQVGLDWRNADAEAMPNDLSFFLYVDIEIAR